MRSSDAARRHVTVVVDSTADIPAPLATELGIVVVPLTVRFGDESFRDRLDIQTAEFLVRLKAASELPKTSQPPVTAFEDVFRSAVEQGGEVICITVSARLSGTFNAARLAAEAVSTDQVRVIDSGGTSMIIGWAAIEAAKAARGGADLAAVQAVAETALARTHAYFVLDTLEYVYKGGRIGKASQLVGSVLSIKPILAFQEGEVRPLERVRTWGKALNRIAELARSHAPVAGLAVLHVGARDDAENMANRLRDQVPDGNVVIAEIGPVLATYGGPGTLAVAVLSAG